MGVLHSTSFSSSVGHSFAEYPRTVNGSLLPDKETREGCPWSLLRLFTRRYTRSGLPGRRMCSLRSFASMRQRVPCGKDSRRLMASGRPHIRAPINMLCPYWVFLRLSKGSVDVPLLPGVGGARLFTRISCGSYQRIISRASTGTGRHESCVPHTTAWIP